MFLGKADARNAGDAGDQDGTEDSIVFDGATIVTPTGKLLARQLSLVIGPQHSILITGQTAAVRTCTLRKLINAAMPPFAAQRNTHHICGAISPAGKSSIFRVLHQLWPLPDGRIGRPTATDGAQVSELGLFLHA